MIRKLSMLFLAPIAVIVMTVIVDANMTIVLRMMVVMIVVVEINTIYDVIIIIITYYVDNISDHKDGSKDSMKVVVATGDRVGRVVLWSVTGIVI